MLTEADNDAIASFFRQADALGSTLFLLASPANDIPLTTSLPSTPPATLLSAGERRSEAVGEDSGWRERAGPRIGRAEGRMEERGDSVGCVLLPMPRVLLL